MDNIRLQECITALNQKGVRMPCPRCGSAQFSVVGEALIPINDNPRVFNFDGPAIPTVMVVCNNCGYLSHHAQAPLGVFKKA